MRLDRRAATPRFAAAHGFAAAPWLAAALAFSAAVPGASAGEPRFEAPAVVGFLESHCADCHNAALAEGGLDLTTPADGSNAATGLARWTLIHDRVRDGEMPPDGLSDEADRAPFLHALAESLTAADRDRVAATGRAQVRRLNRDEYENTLRELLDAPWLRVAEELPADGSTHLFSKSGEALDVSHVQMEKYLEVGRRALRTATDAAAHPPQTRRYYARQETGMRYIDRSPRRTTPVIGWEADLGVLTGETPKTAKGDREAQDREGLAVFHGPHPAFTRYDVESMDPPIDGRYRLRVKSYSLAAGKNGYANGGADPDKPAPKHQRWYLPNVFDLRRSERPEPITLYALRDSGDTRWLASFDAQPEPHVAEVEVTLRKGDNLRPDAARFPRLRPGWSGNPLAVDRDHIPGWVLQWVDVEGPITDEWPPESYTALFGDLPFEVENGEDENRRVRVLSENPDADAERLLTDFAARAFRGRGLPEGGVEPYLGIYGQARELGYDFTDATIAGFSAVLASPRFLYLEAEPGELDPPALAARLSYFLWNGPPDAELLARDDLQTAEVLQEQTDRLLNDPRSDRFVEHFLDHWLELRDLGNTVPDADLYPDYYLDGQLAESALFETRTFFKTLLDENRPARNLIDADFTFVNERLARHYGLDSSGLKHGGRSIELERVELPADSPRGGLLTQASVLKVTANGTTTSPVLRGVWVVERLLGREIPPPPSGIEAIEPDTRGAVTIREQLAKHTETASCAACHAKFDPVGFALESFDVMGGWRETYRALGDVGEEVEGYGMNGHAFEFRLAQPVESAGEWAGGGRFEDVEQLKSLLLTDERAIARNLVHQWVVYGAGEPVSFADRPAVEAILDAAEPSGYGLRDLLHALVQSDLFRQK
ncbi:DUF1592 domain-containing protein [Alienimonas californiensis]|uniref:Cytochrome c domain-containing protein n=1 Tax=Alienimonas californiensis TaxID=2527989 RepID=A0A517P6L2_9PLAN|nr:DUF1592 domain-containing protein [Alienimonas californiensis]QDT15015.1 hypothetical protein CA12_10950 [Alienimonas californiensis]